MNIKDYIPTDPCEIDHVIGLLREDLRPEYRKLVREGKMREYGVAGRLQDALTALIHQHVTGWKQPRDKSDFANLTADRSIADWIRAAARAVCAIDFLESCADRRAVDGIDPEDDKLEWMPDWDRLRVALIELALSLTHAELIDQEKKAAQAERHAAAYRAAEEQVRVFRSGRKKGAVAAHTQYLIDLIFNNPGRSWIELRRIIRLDAQNEDCPFEYDSDANEYLIRSSGRPAKLQSMIDDARRRYVNPANSASAGK